MIGNIFAFWDASLSLVWTKRLDYTASKLPYLLAPILVLHSKCGGRGPGGFNRKHAILSGLDLAEQTAFARYLQKTRSHLTLRSWLRRNDDGTLVRFEADVRTTSPKDAAESTLRNASKSRAFRYNNIVRVRCSCRRVPCERTLEISMTTAVTVRTCVYAHTRILYYSLSLLASRTKGRARARACVYAHCRYNNMYTRRDARAHAGRRVTATPISLLRQSSARFFGFSDFSYPDRLTFYAFLGLSSTGKKLIHVIFIVIYFNEKLYYIIYCVIKKLDSKNIYFLSYLKQFLTL